MVKLPFVTEQVGWVIAPATGALGVAGCEFTTMLELTLDVHPSVLVTVKV